MEKNNNGAMINNVGDLSKSHYFKSGSTTMDKKGDYLSYIDYDNFHKAHERQVSAEETMAIGPAEAKAMSNIFESYDKVNIAEINYKSNRDRAEYEHKSRKHESNSKRFQSLVSADSSNRAAYYHYKANENASKRAYKNNKKQRKRERKMYKKNHKRTWRGF